METETVKVSDVKSLIAKAHATLCVVLHALDTKILVGEINRPSDSVIKVKRKRRTKKEVEAGKMEGKSYRVERPEPLIKMDLEKEYQAGRTSPILSEANRIGNLPDADANNPFYTKKKREKKVDGRE